MDADERHLGDERDVLDAVARVIDSGVFGSSPRLPSLLRYVVGEQLEGRGGKIKAYTIATGILGRGADFDPDTDSIVRVEFHRLRQALGHYYATAGANDAIKIRIPSGSYQPAFERPQTAETAPDIDIHRRITVAVPPVIHDPNDTSLASFANCFKSEVLTALSRVKAFKVVAGEMGQAKASELRFSLQIALQRGDDHLRLNATLFDDANALIWGFAETLAGPNSLAAQTSLAGKLAVAVKPRIYVAARRSIELPGRARIAKSVWELYIEATWFPGLPGVSMAKEKQRKEFARAALKLDPHFAPAHAVLADRLAYLAALDPQCDTPSRSRQAALHAQEAMQGAPDDPDVLFHVAVHYLYAGALERATLKAKRLLELDPNHVVAQLYSKLLPYTCEAAPGEMVEWIDSFDRSLPPDHPLRWLTLAWISLLAINAGDWRTAETAAYNAYQITSVPDTALRYAALLNRAGKKQEAIDIIHALRKNWPGLDVQHYAEVSVPRICANSCGTATHRKLYGDLAATYAAAASLP